MIPVSLTTGVVERRVALGIAPVEVDATPFEKEFCNALLPVAAGVQKSLEIIHSVDFRRV